MEINPNIQRLIEECTETLQGYTYARGNFTERYTDKYKLVEETVKMCLKFIENEHYEAPIREYFGIKK